MKRNVLEILIGFGVIVVAVIFVIYALSVGINRRDSNTGGYILIAKFQNAEGIYIGSDVMLAGVKIGVVDDMKLDNQSFTVVIKLKIDNDIKLPKDSQAAIISSGMIGNKFISISPGGDDVLLSNNDVVIYTQSSLNLESLVDKFIYFLSKENGSKGSQ